jgi:hypothetical protein
MEDRHSRLERQAARVYDLLLGPLLGRARLADHLDEVIIRLRAEQVARRLVDVEL